MRRRLVSLLAALAVLVGVLGIMPGTPASVAGANPASCNSVNGNGWWIHSYAGAGTVMQCVKDGNHYVIRQWIGGVDHGIVFDTWLPGDLVVGVWFASGQATPPLYICGTSSAIGAIAAYGGAPAGWEAQYGFFKSGVQRFEGVANSYLNWPGTHPYGGVTGSILNCGAPDFNRHGTGFLFVQA